MNQKEMRQYISLIKEFPLQSILNDDELNKAIERINTLHIGDSLGEAAYFSALSDLIETYQTKHVKINKLTPGQTLKYLVANSKLAVPVIAAQTGVAPSTINQLMKRAARFSPRTRKILAAYFHVNEELFCVS